MSKLRSWKSIFLSGLFLLQIFSLINLAQASEDRPSLFLYQLKMDVLSLKAPMDDPHREHIAINTDRYFKLLAQMSKLKKFVTSLGTDIAGEIEQGDGVLTGEHIYLIGKSIQTYHQVTLRMLEFSTIYNKSNNHRDPNIFNSVDESITLNNLIWLSNHSILYDHYTNLYELFMREGRVRRTMKNVLKTEILRNAKVDELRVMMAHTIAEGNQKILKKYLKLHHQQRGTIDGLEKSDINDKIVTLSVLISKIKSAQRLRKMPRVFEFSNHRIMDGVVNTLERLTNIISGFFGNTVGMVRWREGHLFSYAPTTERLEKTFKPLDILLEKTRFALTDTFIPGNFGHAALWLGTENQLKEIGLWDSEFIKPHQEKIRQGYTIIEAVRPGVRLTTLEHFMQIDEIAILRNKDIQNNINAMKETYIIALDQLGKDYDFNFDVGTISTVVCSELIFMAMGDVKWPTEFIMGRATISPDNLAELVFFEGSPIELLYYVEAKERHIPIDLNQWDLAERIGYGFNEETSTRENPVFDKKYLSCKDVYNSRIRVGSHRHRRLKKRVCLTKLRHQIYKAPGEYDR